ncbi:unnamed protein product [Moneuplotes crassus]|uniref:Uncharacterized protein n=1 Tax=Euplotes crassus TaxID=5936 RepID=A0AAD2D6D8_EUPCR|nr:unnamed protein product [Moneuplotes crassus]
MKDYKDLQKATSTLKIINLVLLVLDLVLVLLPLRGGDGTSEGLFKREGYCLYFTCSFSFQVQSTNCLLQTSDLTIHSDSSLQLSVFLCLECVLISMFFSSKAMVQAFSYFITCFYFLSDSQELCYLSLCCSS